MARELYDLFWHSGPVSGRGAAVARTVDGATIAVRARKPAVILFPSFLSPAMHFRDGEALDGYFELLLATPDGRLTAEDVNARLVITRGLRRGPVGPSDTLFPATHERIIVEAATPSDNGILDTHSQFRGALHPLWNRHLDAPFRAAGVRYWKVRVHASALAGARESVGPATGSSADPMDEAIARLFRWRNGDAFTAPFRFQVDGGGIHPEVPVRGHLERQLLSHHPLAVYPPRQRTLRTAGHLTDLHLNMRQGLLDCSTAQVIEDPGSTDVSPSIGRLVHRYDRSVVGILRNMQTVDALFVGGDLVDHIWNATRRPGSVAPETPADVWDHVSLESAGYHGRHQAGADFIAAFSALHDFCASNSVPIFGVTGNHDAYAHAYGISPRVGPSAVRRTLANEGIPADHNLTMMEAILAFGPTYHQVHKKFNYDASLLDWYHTVFTPFTDFVVTLPRQRLVNLGWGADERMLSAADRQGFPGFLPRACDTMAPAATDLLTTGFDSARPTVLTSHFTFASFTETIPESPSAHGNALPSGQIWFGGAMPYGDYDFGTFEKQRSTAYIFLATRAASVSAVLTGHSHRKALYMLDVSSPSYATASMIGMSAGSIKRSAVPPYLRDRLPVVLSDSAGPIPRSNVANEFDEWGSDASAGSILHFDGSGGLSQVDVVRAPDCVKPRAVVAFDYMHLQKNAVWEHTVLEFQTVMLRESSPWNPPFWITIDPRYAAAGIHVKDVVFVGRLGRRPASTDTREWVRVRASRTSEQQRLVVGSQFRSYDLWRTSSGEDVRQWLQLGSSTDRYVAIQFTCTDAALAERYRFNDDWWILECATERASGLPRHVEQWRVRALSNTGFGDTSLSRPAVEQPDFDFRRRTFPGKYATRRVMVPDSPALRDRPIARPLF